MRKIVILLSLALLAAGVWAVEALVERETGRVVVVSTNGTPWGVMETNGGHFVRIKVTNTNVLLRLKAHLEEINRPGTEGKMRFPFINPFTYTNAAGQRREWIRINPTVAEQEMNANGRLVTTNSLVRSGTLSK